MYRHLKKNYHLKKKIHKCVGFSIHVLFVLFQPLIYPFGFFCSNIAWTVIRSVSLTDSPLFRLASSAVFASIFLFDCLQITNGPFNGFFWINRLGFMNNNLTPGNKVPETQIKHLCLVDGANKLNSIHFYLHMLEFLAN